MAQQDRRKKGYYKVCHPFAMSEETIGYWNGEGWTFKEIGRESFFDDDDLNWINERFLSDEVSLQGIVKNNEN